MVAAKEKLNSLPRRGIADDHGTSKPAAGTRNFKVYAENDKVKTHSRGPLGTFNSEAKRKSVPINNAKCQANASNLKGAPKKLGKSQGKLESSVRIHVGRRALADISNVRDKHSSNEQLNVPKPLASRPSIGQGVMIRRSSSAKPLMGKLRSSFGEVIGDHHTLKRVVETKDLKPSSNNLRNKIQGYQSATSFGRTSARNALPPTRKSLPASKQVKQENAEILEKGKVKCGFPVKPKAGWNMISQATNTGTQRWKSKGGVDFMTMAPKGQPKMDARASLKKSVKPVVKTTAKVSICQRNSKSKCSSSLNKCAFGTTSSFKEKEGEASCLSEHTGSVCPVEQFGQEVLPTNISGNLATTRSDINAGIKSDRRKSFTSLLMASSKLLKEQGEVAEHEFLPNIYDDCNHLEVAEYVDDIYQYYWVMEAQSQSLTCYMEIQTDVTPQMRGILVNWLIEVHLKFDLMQETLFLMVTLLDSYLSVVSIKKSDMQLVGLTSLLLASKYEDFWHPRVVDLISISPESYSRDRMLGMEKAILRKLMFRLNAPTPYVFMLRFLKAAQSDAKFEHLSFYLIELCLVEYEALKFKPSLICASAIYVARCTLKMTPLWTPLLSKHSRYVESQIRECAKMILRFHRGAGMGRLRVTYEKYMRPECSRVATIKPMDRLPLMI